MKLLKTGKAAELLGVSPSTIKHWIRMVQLRIIKTLGQNGVRLDNLTN